jgi:hypothetical protein
MSASGFAPTGLVPVRPQFDRSGEASMEDVPQAKNA